MEIYNKSRYNIRRVKKFKMWFKTNLIHLLLLFCYCTVYIQGETRDGEQIVPHFIKQPSSSIHFLNSSGAMIDCEVAGLPKISWVINRDASKPANDIPNIRQTLANGSLWLEPFAPELYRQEVHSTTINCLAENEIGAILSRDIQITAVIEQQYDIQVYDEFVLMGNTAVLRCHIPSFLKEHLSVIGWIRSIENSNYTNNRKHLRNKNLIKKNKINYHSNEFEQHIYSDISLKGRYSIFKTGELHIRNVTLADSTSGYRCLMHNQLTNQKRISGSGRLIVQESSGTVPPRITHSPPSNIYARVGEQLELPCASQAYPLPSYTWSGPLLNKSNEELKLLLNSSIKLSSSFKFQNLTSIKPIQLSGSLYFDNLQIYHEGEYHCLVRNSAGDEKVQLNLHVLEPLKIKIEPILSKNQLGDQVEFKCTIKSRPKGNLTWFKNGHKLELNNRFKIIDNLSNDNDKDYYSKLIIFDIHQEDAGFFQCFSTNNYFNEQAVARLELGYSLPVLHFKFKPVTVDFTGGKNEQLVTLRCETSGNPLPKIQWFLDGYQLFSNSQIIDKNLIKLSNRIDNSPPITRLVSEIQILIKNTKQSTNLSGLYSCVANNLLGSSQHFARLNVPGIIGMRKILPQKLISGMPLIINSCPYTGYPVDSIQWFRDSIKLPVNRRQSVYLNGTLIVYNAQKGSDDGLYECRVNQAGIIRNQSVEVLIKKSPVLEQFNFPRNLELGMRARLVCTLITGDPPFTFTWLWNGRKILTSPTSELDSNNNDNKNNELKKEPEGKYLEGISMKVDEFSADLSFASVTEQHNGNYSCKVNNDVASIEHTTQLKVNVPPYFKVEPRDVSVLVGMNARLDCLTGGQPVPVISWERAAISDGNQIGQNLNTNQLNSQFVGIRTSDDIKYNNQLLPNGSLLITNAQKSDQGLWLCISNNGVGAGLSKMVSLTVHSAPHFDIDLPLTYSVRLKEPITFECNVSGDKPISSLFKSPSGSLVSNIFENRESLNLDNLDDIHGQRDLENKNQININNNSSTINDRFQIISKLRKLSSIDDKIERWSVGSLTITQVLPQDSGYYFCTVENEYGSADLPYKLIVQESPYKPTDIKLLENGSRKARISWKQNYNGNSEITRYWIFCHLQFSKGNDSGVNASVVSFEGNLNTAIIHGLRPAEAYFCSVRAENEVGLSESSDHVEVFTKQEAPESTVSNLQAEAIDSRSIKINFNPPPEYTHNGKLKGYYIGYRKLSNDQVLYKTLELGEKSPFQLNSNDQTESNSNNSLISNQLSIVLSNLKPFTDYLVTVQAYNSIGTGPASSPINVRTLEDAPDEPPKQVKCFNQSSQSLLLSWRSIDEYSLNGILLGYRIRLRPLGANFNSTITLNVTATETEQLVNSLNKFTNYSVQIFGFNSKGESPSSKAIYCRTNISRKINCTKNYVSNSRSDQMKSNSSKATNRDKILFPTCRTMEDVPGPPKTVRVLIIGSDSALVCWLDPVEANGIIPFLKFTIYWREYKNNRTKTSITIPRSVRLSGSLNGNLQSSSGSLNIGAKYFYLLKNGIRKKYRRLPDYNNNNQYKLSALKENVEYQLWITASNRRGEGAPSKIIHFKPSRNTEPKILEFSQSIPFRSISNTNNNLANNVPSLSNLNHSSIADQSLPILLTCTVFSTERVQRKWTKSSITSSNLNDSIILDHEPDGSLLINNFNLDQLPMNFSCTVSNSIGSDQVVYNLFKEEHHDFALNVQILSTTYNSAQIVFSTTLPNNHLDNKDYEIHYRSLNNEFINSLNPNTEYEEWNILPIFLPALINDKQQHLQIFGNQSETLQINDLECGAAYELFVKQPLNAWQSELVQFRTLGQAPIAPSKTDILQLSNRTLYIQLNAWLIQNPLPTLSPTNSLPLTFKRSSTTSSLLLSDQLAEEINQQNYKNQKVEGCPIAKFLCEYRTSNTGLWKLINVQQADSNLQPIELNMLNEKVIYTIRITAYTVGKPFSVVEYDIRLNEQGLADYDEFLVLDNEDNITPMNINSKALLFDNHTVFSIICSTLILLALGFVLLLLLIQRRRGLLLRSNVNLDKNIYRKVINNNGDNTSASLLQSTIAYNRSINTNSISYNRPINNNSTSALLQSNAISSSNAIANNINNADSNYVTATAALAAAVAVASINNCSPRTTASNYNQCNKMIKPQELPPIPSLPPPPLSTVSKRSNQLSVYKQSTLVANHRKLNNSNNNNQDEEITPYATFTMSTEEILEQENLLNASDQLPPNIQELHEMHRQLSKMKQQQQQQQPHQVKLKNNTNDQLVSASVIDLFKFNQSTPQQYLKQQMNDKIGISRSKTAVDRSTVVDNSPSKRTTLRKSNNLIYITENDSNSLEKKLLDDEESDLRMFSIKCGESGYVRYCMEGNIRNLNNQLINNSNQLLDVDEEQLNILTPPTYYLNTIDRDNQNLKLINRLNQLNQMNASIKELNQLDAGRADSSADTCSALYEFSCIFNNKKNDLNQNKLPNSSNLVGDDKISLINNRNEQMNRSSKNKNLIRLIDTTNMINNYKDENMINKLMPNNMINNNEQQQHEECDDEEISEQKKIDLNSELSSDLNSDNENSEILDSEFKSKSNKMNSSEDDKKENDDDDDDLNNFQNSSLTATTYNLNYTVNETNKIIHNDDEYTIDDSNDNLKFNQQCNKLSNKFNGNLVDSITGQQNFKAISRLRKSSYSDMQTMLITDQKSHHQTKKMVDNHQKNRLNKFKNMSNQDKKSEAKRKDFNNRPLLRSLKSKIDEVDC